MTTKTTYAGHRAMLAQIKADLESVKHMESDWSSVQDIPVGVSISLWPIGVESINWTRKGRQIIRTVWVKPSQYEVTIYSVKVSERRLLRLFGTWISQYERTHVGAYGGLAA